MRVTVFMISKSLSKVVLSIFHTRGTKRFGVSTKLEHFLDMIHGAIYVCISSIKST